MRLWALCLALASVASAMMRAWSPEEADQIHSLMRPLEHPVSGEAGPELDHTLPLTGPLQKSPASSISRWPSLPSLGVNLDIPYRINEDEHTSHPSASSPEAQTPLASASQARSEIPPSQDLSPAVPRRPRTRRAIPRTEKQRIEIPSARDRSGTPNLHNSSAADRTESAARVGQAREKSRLASLESNKSMTPRSIYNRLYLKRKRGEHVDETEYQAALKGRRDFDRDSLRARGGKKGMRAELEKMDPEQRRKRRGGAKSEAKKRKRDRNVDGKFLSANAEQHVTAAHEEPPGQPQPRTQPKGRDIEYGRSTKPRAVFSRLYFRKRKGEVVDEAEYEAAKKARRDFNREDTAARGGAKAIRQAAQERRVKGGVEPKKKGADDGGNSDSEGGNGIARPGPGKLDERHGGYSTATSGSVEKTSVPQTTKSGREVKMAKRGS